MSINRLEVSGVRNLREIKLDDCRRINIFSGPNGSGKTSILEAIYLLGLGRSFRASRTAPIINHELDAYTVYGELSGGAESGLYHNLGVRRTRRGQQDFRINKERVAGAAELARALPIQLINADALGLIEGGPKLRRQFMDWGVFHVKPDFLERWRSTQYCLRQRNHLLRGRRARRHGNIYPPEIAAWDKELARVSIEIDGLRDQYIEDIRPIFDEILQRITNLPGLSLHYRRGWRADAGLQVIFEEDFDRDVSAGATTAGPHRANIDICLGGQPAVDVLSRGQLKLVVISLKLAQGWLLAKRQGRHCIYLIDDLPAELDSEHRVALCRLLDEMGPQVFITSVDADVIEGCWRSEQDVRRFHVKRGLVGSGPSPVIDSVSNLIQKAAV